MLRYFYIVVVCFFISELCLAEQVPLEQLIRGANWSRNQIKSGELRVLITQDYPESPEDIEKRIQARIQANQENLKRLRAVGEEAWFLEHIRRTSDMRYFANGLNVAFQIFDEDPIRIPEIYQYKLTEMDRREMDDLYDESKRVRYGGYYRVNTYDGKIQAHELLQAPPPKTVSFSKGVKRAGFLPFYFYGRPWYKIPPGAALIGRKTIREADCYLLEYRVKEKKKISPKQLIIRLWVDPQKQFCIRREYIKQTFEHSQQSTIWEKVYEDFRKYEEIWYPLTIRETHQTDGKIVSVNTITVKDAQFNLNFPSNFFHVDPKFYLERGLAPTGNSEISLGSLGGISQQKSLALNKPANPDKSPTEPDALLLTCGPNSLLRICELLKVDTNFNELAQLLRFHPEQGTTMLGLRDAAEYKGLNPKGIKVKLKSLKKNKVPMPAIAYVKGNHFLVFEKVVSNGILISDPADKYDRHLTFKELSAMWNGELIIFDYHPEQADSTKPVPLLPAKVGFHDFGEVLGGTEIKHTFKLKNIGQKPLKIAKVEQSCACTATIVSKDEIAPGEFGVIEAVLKVPAENRQVEESINVYTNDPTQNRVTLILKGTAFVPISTFPHRLLIGSIQPKTGVTKSLTIHQKGKTQILGIRTDSSHLVAKIVSQKDDPIIRVEVTLSESAPVGQFSYNLLVDYRYEGKEATHDVSIFGEVLGAFRVTPKRFFFGLVKDSEAVSKITTISSLDDQPFKIISVESSVKVVIATAAKSTDESSYRIITTIAPKSASGELSGEIIIKTDSTIQPTLRIPFFGIIGESN